MKFDNKGFLTPYEILEANLATFEKVFVLSFSSSSTRKLLFDGYKLYVNKLKEIVQGPFFQWIDGSYVTNKFNPADIDVVSFINYKIIENNEKNFGELKYPASKANYGVDGYIVKIYPDGHKNKFIEEFDTIEWFHQFNKTKRNRIGNTYLKGFIKIQFT